MNKYLRVIKSLFSNYLFLFFLGIALFFYYYSHSLSKPIIIGFDVSVILIIGIILFFLQSQIAKNRRPMYVFRDRAEAMQADLDLMKMPKPNSIEQQYILTTRFGHWEAIDIKSTKEDFGNEIAKKIKGNYVVKRIWQIHNSKDLERLVYYLDVFKDYENYSMKYFIGDAIIPELLSVHGEVASIAFPHPKRPKSMVSTFHFSGKQEIDVIEKYFEVYWENSNPIKIGDKIFYDELKKIKEAMIYFENKKKLTD